MHIVTRDFWIGLGLLGFCLFALFYLVPTQIGAFDSAAALLPVGVLTLLMGLAVLLTAQGMRRTAAEVRSRPTGRVMAKRTLLLVGIVAVVLGYSQLVTWTGFFATSLLALATLLVMIGVRRPLPIAAVSLGVVATLYVVFGLLLKAPLPEGILIDTVLH